MREPRPERLERAEAWGAEHHGNELVDVAIVCTPKPEAIESAADTVAPGGTLCLYAPPSPQRPPGSTPPRCTCARSPCRELFGRPRRHAGGARTDRDKRIDPRPLVSHRLPLEETAHALDLQRRAGGLKIVVEP